MRTIETVSRDGYAETFSTSALSTNKFPVLGHNKTVIMGLQTVVTENRNKKSIIQDLMIRAKTIAQNFGKDCKKHFFEKYIKKRHLFY